MIRRGQCRCYRRRRVIGFDEEGSVFGAEMCCVTPGRVRFDLGKRLIGERLHVPSSAARIQNDFLFAARASDASFDLVELASTTFLSRRHGRDLDRWLYARRNSTTTNQHGQQTHYTDRWTSSTRDHDETIISHPVNTANLTVFFKSQLPR